jgi:hypothetical protein
MLLPAAINAFTFKAMMSLMFSPQNCSYFHPSPCVCVVPMAVKMCLKAEFSQILQVSGLVKHIRREH